MGSYFLEPINTKYPLPSLTLISPSILSNQIRKGFVQSKFRMKYHKPKYFHMNLHPLKYYQNQNF